MLQGTTAPTTMPTLVRMNFPNFEKLNVSIIGSAQNVRLNYRMSCRLRELQHQFPSVLFKEAVPMHGAVGIRCCTG